MPYECLSGLQRTHIHTASARASSLFSSGTIWGGLIANALAILETQLMPSIGRIDHNCGLHLIQVIGAQIGNVNLANVSGDFDAQQSLSRDIDRILQHSQWGAVHC